MPFFEIFTNHSLFHARPQTVILRNILNLHFLRGCVMERHFKQSIGMALILNSLCLHADGIMSDVDFSGFSAGVGGSYTHTTVTGETNTVMYSPFVPVIQYDTNENLESNLSPVVNAGYFFKPKNNWLVGVKGVYKYIGVKQFDVSWTGTYQNGVYQQAIFNTKLQQELFVLFNAGYSFGHWLVYGGIGPSATQVQNQLIGNMLPPTSLNFQHVTMSQSKILWGAAGQVGFEYMLPNRFTIDLSYNFVGTPSSTLPSVRFNTGTSDVFSLFTQKAYLTEQGINISVNKYF